MVKTKRNVSIIVFPSNSEPSASDSERESQPGQSKRGKVEYKSKFSKEWTKAGSSSLRYLEIHTISCSTVSLCSRGLVATTTACTAKAVQVFGQSISY